MHHDIERTAPDSAYEPKSWAEPALHPECHLLRSDAVPSHRGKAGKPVNGSSENAPPAGRPVLGGLVRPVVPPASAVSCSREKGQTMTRSTSQPAGQLRARPAVIRAHGQAGPERPGVPATTPALSVRGHAESGRTERGPAREAQRGRSARKRPTPTGAIPGRAGPCSGRPPRRPPPRAAVAASRTAGAPAEPFELSDRAATVRPPSGGRLRKLFSLARALARDAGSANRRRRLQLQAASSVRAVSSLKARCRRRGPIPTRIRPGGNDFLRVELAYRDLVPPIGLSTIGAGEIAAVARDGGEAPVRERVAALSEAATASKGGRRARCLS